MPAGRSSARRGARSAGPRQHGRADLDRRAAAPRRSASTRPSTAAPHAYFDAAVSLLFFLLIGRELDTLMRERARTAAGALVALAAARRRGAPPDGTRRYLPIGEIAPRHDRRWSPPASACRSMAVVAGGRSDLDCALVTGESLPQPVGPGVPRARRHAQPDRRRSTLDVTAPAERTLLAEIVRLMEAAEGGRARYRAHRRPRSRGSMRRSCTCWRCSTFVGWVVRRRRLASGAD